VAERVIGTDHVVNNAWLVTSGLKAGDRVIVDGLQKARPGQKVRAVEAAVESTEAPKAGAAPEVASR
jgi:membrane fusion protein (multidrug efflux system)